MINCSGSKVNVSVGEVGGGGAGTNCVSKGDSSNDMGMQALN